MLEKIKPEDLSLNPFSLIGKDWMLISAGTEQKYNMMTASWGGLGVFWGRNVASTYIRPQRYTLEFVNEQEYYALNFFDESYKKALSFCGAHSGRDTDKQKETGLIPAFDEKAPYFKEAKLVLICRKLHRQILDPAGFLDDTIDERWYPEKDYHNIFQGEIVTILQNKSIAL